MGTGVLSSEEKQPECEADHPPLSALGVQNMWGSTGTQAMYLQAIVLRHRVNLTVFV
jgi:hypothetical protein